MADRNWQDRAIEIVGGIGDRLSDLARRATKPATDYLEPRLKDVAKTSSDVATQIWEDPEIIFGEDTGNPLPVSILTGLVPGGGIAEHELAGKDPGLIEALDALPGGGSLAALGKAGFFALAKAERKEIFKKVMEALQILPQKANQMFEAFELMPESVKNSWLAQFADMSVKRPNGTQILRKHSTVIPDPNDGATHWSWMPSNRRGGGEIHIEPRLRDFLNPLLHEGGHGFDHQVNVLLDPFGSAYGGVGHSGLTKEWYDRIPDAPPELASKIEDGVYNPSAFSKFILNSIPQKYRDAGFTMINNDVVQQDGRNELVSAMETLNQGIKNRRNRIWEPLPAGDKNIDYSHIKNDSMHDLPYYLGSNDPIGRMATEAVAKATELMPTKFQTLPIGKHFAEVLEDNPVRFYDLDFNPFVGGDLKSLAGTK